MATNDTTLTTRTVNDHTAYVIDDCGEWDWTLLAVPTDTDFRGTLRAVKHVPYEGQEYRTNGDRPNRVRKASEHQLHASEVVSFYAGHSDLTEAELWNRVTEAFAAEDEDAPERYETSGSEPADFGGGESTGVQDL